MFKKSDPNIIVPTKRIIHKNYDTYDNNDKTSPGGGFFQNMHKYKSIKDFFNKKRKRNKDLGVLKLNSVCKYFLKLAALEFGEGTEWIPEKFKENKTFKNYPFKNALKIFKKFGLNDFRTEINLKINQEPVIQESLKQLNESIITNLSLAANYIDNIIESFSNNKNLDKFDDIYDMILKLKHYIQNNKDKKIIEENIESNKKIIFSKGMSLFKAYNKVKNEIEKFNYMLPNLDKIQEFKNYSNSQKPSNVELVFSTKTSDICGMGNRGIISCQSLLGESNVDHSDRLVGSVLSKYLGICYITNKSNWKDRGEKMLYRSLVRFVIDGSDNSPLILIDKLYPDENDHVTNLMIEKIQEKSKIPVYSINEVNASDFYIREENFIPEFQKSYQDTAYTGKLERKIPFKKLVYMLTKMQRPNYNLLGELENYLNNGYNSNFQKEYETLLQSKNKEILAKLAIYLELSAEIINFIMNMPKDQMLRILQSFEITGENDRLEFLSKKIDEAYGIYEEDKEETE